MAQERPGVPQERPGEAQERPEEVQRGPGEAQERPRKRPGEQERPRKDPAKAHRSPEEAQDRPRLSPAEAQKSLQIQPIPSRLRTRTVLSQKRGPARRTAITKRFLPNCERAQYRAKLLPSRCERAQYKAKLVPSRLRTRTVRGQKRGPRPSLPQPKLQKGCFQTANAHSTEPNLGLAIRRGGPARRFRRAVARCRTPHKFAKAPHGSAVFGKSGHRAQAPAPVTFSLI